MRARPRVTYQVQGLTRQQVFDRFKSALTSDGCPCAGSVGRTEVTLYICENLRKVWSPWLQLGVTEADGVTRVHGKMGPQPNLWTAYVFVYSVHVAIFTAGSMYGFVQATLDDSPTGFWASIGALTGLALFCSLDLVGRRLSQGQMGVIRGFVTRTLPEAVEIDENENVAALEHQVAGSQ